MKQPEARAPQTWLVIPCLLLALLAISGVESARAQASLQYNVVYFCPAERVVVVRCRDETDAAYCSVQYPDRKGPETGGMTPELAETRGSVVEKLRSCRLEGQGPPVNAPAADVAPRASEFASVSVNSELMESGPQSFSCGLTTAGAALCWGFNGGGQLGDGTTTDRNAPVAVSGGHRFASLATGSLHACGVTTAGTAWCWGYGEEGQLGDGANTLGSFLPVAVAGGHAFTSVSAGHRYTCGVTAAGKAYCWGSNLIGKLGAGTIGDSNVPVAVADGHLFASVTAGADHTCGVTTAGSAWCWGFNINGQLGTGGSGDDYFVPVAVSGDHAFASVSTGDYHTCGVTTAGAAYCWGSNDPGALGDGTNH